MRLAFLLIAIACAGLLSAQQPQWSPTVRSITIKLTDKGRHGIPHVEFESIAASWRAAQINLAVETNLDTDSIGKAKAVLREIYRRRGHAVRVEHRVNQMPTRSVEVAFEVVEICEPH
jgi:hypothetical protein